MESKVWEILEGFPLKRFWKHYPALGPHSMNCAWSNCQVTCVNCQVLRRGNEKCKRPMPVELTTLPSPIRSYVHVQKNCG